MEELIEADERVVWVGRPNSDRLLRRSDYAAVWGGVLLGTVAMALLIAGLIALTDRATTGGVAGVIVALLLGALALYLVFGRLARRFGRTRGTAYMITSTRVLAIRADDVQETALTSDVDTHLAMHYEGRGTITVGSVTFENVDDAAVVYEHLQAQIAQLAQLAQFGADDAAG